MYKKWQNTDQNVLELPKYRHNCPKTVKKPTKKSKNREETAKKTPKNV